jgi:hypothetical protein
VAEFLARYYRILGIPPDSDEKALKKAFRKLALRLHPDVNKSPDSTEKFQDLCEAYEVILRQIRIETIVTAGNGFREEQDTYSYEEILREARQKAYERARMKYEKMKAEQELFEQSNWRDVFLMFNYIGRFLALPLALFLIVIPVIIAVSSGIGMFFALFFFWIIGGLIIVQFISNRKKWFRQGKLRWKLSDILKWFDFSPVTCNPVNACHYCRGRMANGRDFIMTLLKVKDVRLRNDGIYQHYVAYKRKYKEVLIPRSTRAYTVHYLQSVLKFICLTVCLIWLPFPSLIWRVAGGLTTGLILSFFLCKITFTKSKVEYLLNAFILIKIFLWGLVIISQTTVYPGFILQTTIFAPFYLLLLMIFGDMFLDLIFRLMPFYSRLYVPLIRQSQVVMNFYRHGYQNFLDIPVWSTIYPLARWFV